MAGHPSSRRCILLVVYWLIDVIRNFLTKQASARSTAWAQCDRIELYDAACRMAGKPTSASFQEEPKRSYHRRLKDAIRDRELIVLDMRGSDPTTITLVTRNALRDYPILKIGEDVPTKQDARAIIEATERDRAFVLTALFAVSE